MDKEIFLSSITIVSLYFITSINRSTNKNSFKISPLLQSLSLDYLSDEMSHADRDCLARIIFNHKGTWQQQLESLSINKIHLQFGFRSLQLMTNLHHLTMNINYLIYVLIDLVLSHFALMFYG
jgi:hypothetical protein